ncbi:DUF2269 domain-containing protein [Corynebacterium endometrii]|uniref:DUF2269 domain-containing protein n=1 Tax=Corynebacterium endometrii TaxID=2488819 RepID=A0A4P7QHB5_9CORY|nr:DUF2269 domain-containing protein [Corynebacterium endometrii]QCB28214.1 hypothetical protein CENDO_04620 [Corynebacterium endometrii]
MSLILYILHVVAAILLLGPVTVAVSSFQGQMLKASTGDTAALGAARVLHRISDQYGLWSVLVPVFGAALLFVDWATYGQSYNFHLAIVLSIVAWGILFFLVTPKQKKAMAALEAGDHSFDYAKAKKQLSMFSGIFCLVWLITALSMFA